MIVDIIPMPVKLPPYMGIDTETRFWVTNQSLYGCPIDEELMPLGRVFDTNQQLFRYKIIEARVGMMIERSIISLDELDIDTLGYVNDPSISVEIYTITTKIHKCTLKGTEIVAYRHMNTIKELLHKIHGTRKDDMYSVHQLYLHGMIHTTAAYKMHDVNEVLHAYAADNAHRLGALVCANEFINTKLASNITSLIDLQCSMVSSSLYREEVTGILEGAFKLPYLDKYDSLSMLIAQHSSIPSHKLRNYLSLAYLSRHYNMAIVTHDIFEVDDSVIYEIPEELRWLAFPLLNKLELLPYTDLSIEFTGLTGTLHVHYAISQFGKVEDVKTLLCEESLGLDMDMSNLQNAYSGNYTVLTDLSICLSKLICQLPIDAPQKDLNYNLVKTFQDDVYLHIRSSRTGKSWKYYFDLTIQALGTRGIVGANIMNHVARSASAIHYNNFDTFWPTVFANGIYTQ